MDDENTARMSQLDISTMIPTSGAIVGKKIKKLEENNVILHKGFKIMVNPEYAVSQHAIMNDVVELWEYRNRMGFK